MEVINIGHLRDKWVKLLLRLQNSTSFGFQCVFPDKESASRGLKQLSNAIRTHPTWFKMIVVQKGTTVYALKTQFIKKVVIVDDE